MNGIWRFIRAHLSTLESSSVVCPHDKKNLAARGITHVWVPLHRYGSARLEAESLRLVQTLAVYNGLHGASPAKVLAIFDTLDDNGDGDNGDGGDSDNDDALAANMQQLRLLLGGGGVDTLDLGDVLFIGRRLEQLLRDLGLETPDMWTWRTAVFGIERACAMCLKIAERGLKKCAGCTRVRYCGQDCQRKDWPEHREECARWSGINTH